VLVGLTGGIGGGKSEALRAFRRHGAVTLSSDDSVRTLYGRDEVKRAVAEHFGDQVIGPDGAVDRAAIGRIVFADAAELRWLEGLLLPLLAEEFAAWRDRESGAGAQLLVHEAPTLFEVGVGDRYDAVLTVTAPAELREGRRPGSRPQMAHQLPEAEKIARSDYVYENTGTLDDLDRFVAGLAERLLR
jgi:dephospho-CoA kinase